MANEAVLIVETEIPINFTVANATAITKGSILKMTDPMTAIITSAANDPVAGIIQSDKIASDGVTKAAVFREGVFKVSLSGSCTVGDALVTDASPNFVKTAPTSITLSGSNIIGTALETGTTGQTILMELKPHTTKNN